MDAHARQVSELPVAVKVEDEPWLNQERKRDLRDAAIAIGLVVGVIAVDAAIDAAKERAKAAARRRVQRAIRKQAVKLLKAELKRRIDAL